MGAELIGGRYLKSFRASGARMDRVGREGGREGGREIDSPEALVLSKE
jgi:hypothetical protein